MTTLTTLGFLTDAACFIAVFVYMPLANWLERKPKKYRKYTQKANFRFIITNGISEFGYIENKESNKI